MSRSARVRDSTDTVSILIQFVQKAFIVHDRNLLLVRKADADPHYPGYWEVPGGRMKPGEDINVHIRREVWEETGISIVPGPPFHVWQWEMPGPVADEPTRIQVVAIARNCQPLSLELTTKNQVVGDHLDDVRWVPIDDLEGYGLIPSLKPAVEDFLQEYR